MIALFDIKSTKFIIACLLTVLLFSVFLNFTFYKNTKELKNYSGGVYYGVIDQAIYKLQHTNFQEEIEETIDTYMEIEVLTSYLPGNIRVFMQTLLHEQMTDLLALNENNNHDNLYKRIQERENYLIESLNKLKEITYGDPITTFDELIKSDSEFNKYILSRLNSWIQK